MAKYNKYDPEECDACIEIDDICDFHVGVAVGWDLCAAAVARAVIPN